MALYCIRYSYEISIHAPHTGRDAPLWPHMVTRWKFQSTRPIRGATSLPSGRKLYYVISIHAPHTGRDCGARQRGSLRGHFNPRAPYGARRPSRCRCLHRGYFNPRAPYGARHTKNVLSLYSSSISIHAPHTGRDGAKHNYYICSNKFQSTRPIRGATHRRGRQALQDHISIHAPHTGRDLADKTVCATLNRISIHAPHTGRDARVPLLIKSAL